MESAVAANVQIAGATSGGGEPSVEQQFPQVSNHEDGERKHHVSDEEIKAILEVIAATGKFWHEWDTLRSLLSFRLKQVLAEYAESHSSTGASLQQNTFPGEAYLELVRRLDEALLEFADGPPFTLQRLCEILLAPRATYRSLPKLSLALEKNLFVTSTLSRCMEPYTTTLPQNHVVLEKRVDLTQDQPSSVPTGAQGVVGDGDVEMVDAETEDDVDSSKADIEMREKGIETTHCPLEPNNVGSKSSTTTDQENPTSGEVGV